MSDASPSPTAAGPNADLTGRLLGDFQLLRRLGQGGMGQVYLAEQISLKRKVALKLLKPDLAADETALRRFRKEAEAVAQATHANIVQVYAIGESDGVNFMALEYVEGLNLREYLAKKGPPPLALALNVMRQVAAALARAGELGIVHRDIKPENILVTRKGEVKVADFGLSRCFAADAETQQLTQTGIAMGTPLYMSPEQVQAKPLDARSDIYSFGASCYHLLSGQAPFRGDSPFTVALQHVQARATPLAELRPDLPPELCAVVEKMMAKDPAQRFQTGREVLRELNRLREALASTQKIPAAASAPAAAATTLQTPVAPSEPTPADAGAVRACPSRTPWLVAFTVLLGLVAGVALAWGKHRWSDDSRPVERVAAAPATNEEEQFLRKEAEQHAVPGRGPQAVERGARAQLALGVYLLDHERWQEAERFFQALTAHKNLPYRDLGRLGRAVVLAYRDQPVESNELFLALANELRAAEKQQRKNRVRQLHALNDPKLRTWMARALDRNAANCEGAKTAFPAELQHFRNPGPLTAAGAEGKSPEKNSPKGDK